MTINSEGTEVAYSEPFVGNLRIAMTQTVQTAFQHVNFHGMTNVLAFNKQSSMLWSWDVPIYRMDITMGDFDFGEHVIYELPENTNAQLLNSPNNIEDYISYDRDTRKTFFYAYETTGKKVAQDSSEAMLQLRFQRDKGFIDFKQIVTPQNAEIDLNSIAAITVETCKVRVRCVAVETFSSDGFYPCQPCKECDFYEKPCTQNSNGICGVPTNPPTTNRPITSAPTTSDPTTSQPTTAGPTTDEPTTTSPTTMSPTTVEPTTTNSPTTKFPTTAEPTTADPTTVSPTTKFPTTVEPTTAGNTN